jgi:hypothetical protein
MDASSFHAGLLDPDQVIPEGLLDGEGQPAGKRYAVYRNNVTVSLIEAMKAAFPLVEKLIGPQNFAQLARLFVRAHPPISPIMMYYGTEFPEFIQRFEPLTHIGYLADAARLDLALRHSYHAKDAPAFDPSGFQTLDPQSLLDATITLAPATIILRSDWPLHDIWAFNQDPNNGKPRGVRQDVLITRPAFDPAPHILPQGGTVWLQALRDGATFGAANDTATNATPDFNLTTNLSLALSVGALATLNHKDLI